MADRPREILVIHTWGIGDMIMLTPALRAAKTLHPGLRVTLLVFQRGAALPVWGAPYVDKVDFAGWNPADLLRAILRLRGKRFDAALFSTGVTPWKAWLFLLPLRATRRIGEYRTFKPPFLQRCKALRETDPRPRANYELLAEAVALPPWEEALSRADELGLRADFQLQPANRDWADNFIADKALADKPLLALHPGSMAKFRFKRWPQEYFADLIRLVAHAYDCHLVVIAGPDELAEGEYLRAQTGVLLLDRGSLADTAAFIARCQAFVNTDSGLGHIASCFLIPSLTIVGPGDERQTAPFSPASRVIRKHLPCAPCIRRKDRACALECLRQLTPDTVFAELAKILDQAGFPPRSG